jgi:cyclic beta-1,2-glucan synthetase
VPGLGLKRGLIEDLVVSPYSTLLATAARPREAIENMRLLEQEGALARYGFYEAIDYTPERLPQNQKRVLIRAFMAHHQGMGLVALDNLINNRIMQQRFHAEPLVQATELLLQERIPRGVTAAHPRAEEVLTGRVVRTLTGLVTRVYDTPHLPTPRTQLLSNGTYSVMITSAGSGYSACGQLAVTRWREDVTRDNWGSYCYVRDVRSGAVWSTGFQPVGREPQAYEVAFSEDKVDFWRQDAGIFTHTEVVVSAEDNAELRRVSVANNSFRPREIELTSYSEIVLAPPAADVAHPAFSNLFVETEFFAAESALLAHRRQRSATDEPIWGVHVIATTGETIGVVQYETDRTRFVGRGHTPADPIAVMEDRPLSNTTGPVLDPVFSLRCRMRLMPNETAQVSFATAVARSRDEATALADKYHDPHIFERETRLAWTRAQVEMSHLNIDAEEAHLFQRLAGRVLYSDPSLRPSPYVLGLNTQAQSNLWPYGISGDLPIVLVRINKEDDVGMARQIVRAHEYLHLKGLRFDLVILNDHPASYAQSLQDGLQALVRTTGLQGLQDKPGGVYLRRADLMPEADKILLHAVARAVFVTERGSLQEQLVRRPAEDLPPDPFVQRLPSRSYPEPVLTPPKLSFFNGLGGFSEGGREYVTALGEGQWTPAPWSNIIANKVDFGFQVTETGSGFTWSMNSHENRLIPWSNDAVSDPPGEAIYIRDEETGAFWTPTPLPVREAQPYLVRHGQGYTVIEHISHGISQELLVFVPLDDPVKVSLLRLQNRTDRARRLSVTNYNELVLGSQRSSAAPYVIAEIDETAGAIFARNPYNNEFAGRIAFAGANGEAQRTMTCDRKEFLGRNGSPANPAALRRAHLSGRDGAGLDPCAAIQTAIELQPGEARELVFLLGQGESIAEARAVNKRYRQLASVHEAFEEVTTYWEELSSAIQVHTPDAAMDTLLNRWLIYQTLSCRVWARSAFYQSGGAYGFRDQLQDVMALVYAKPEIAREHILRAAAHQFKEGDVQHWWHPPTGRGVRTRFSDDLLWLPYVVSFYVSVTGDMSVLEEVVPFIEAPPLAADEHESYTQPAVSSEAATVFEHCARAVDRSLAVGAHGLPLMGSGDWNDGMNRVGHLGKGESVWVGWFLYTILASFSPLCESHKQKARANRYRRHMDQLKKALEHQGWDGDWYRRAYFDDGTPLGSVQNEECRIDSIVQSWGVMSGASDHHRGARAMAAVEEYLIRRGDGLVILFTPPFDKSALDPGYIKGYVPGVRENGGQYTHAALWTLIAYAMLGEGDQAGELFALLNPINHASTRAGLHKYKVEPYVAAGDVYAVPPHTGRGGWTWYTGSAGWMYRAGLESILGFKLRGDRLQMDPCIPRNWREFEIIYRRDKTHYRIKVENPIGISRGVARVELDGILQKENEVTLIDDGRPHNVLVVLGEKPPGETQRPAAAEKQRAGRSQ